MYIEQEINWIKGRIKMLISEIEELKKARQKPQPKISNQLKSIVDKATEENPFEIKFIKIEPTGFYRYQIKHKGNVIKFIIEPSLIPAYDFIIQDMIERQKKTPRVSYVDNPDMKTAFTDIDMAISRMDQMIKTIDERKKNNERQDV